MEHIILIILVFMAPYYNNIGNCQNLLDVQKFTEEMRTLATEALGTDHIQELFDTKAEFTAHTITSNMATYTVNQLSDKLSERFRERFAGIEKIKKTAEDAYRDNNVPTSTNYDGKYKECCKLREQDLEYDARFFTEVDSNDMCYQLSRDRPGTYDIPAFSELEDVLVENFLNEQSLKWQLYGTEEGVMIQYPAHLSASCNNYDPRFRPWYVEASSPVAKDLILVIDSSGSMGTQSRMDIAKQAAITVVETLSPNDRIGIVRFSSEASTPPGSSLSSRCYNSYLAYAIPENVSYLKKYIGTITAGGQTGYLAALERAFGLLRETKGDTSQTREKVILFLTDGNPTDSNMNQILERISQLNGECNNEVTIMTYGLQLDDQPTRILLEAMATQTESDPSKGDINKGVFKQIDSVENIRLDLGTYYSHFNRKTQLEQPVVSVPYVDFSGLGLVTTICDTVLHDGELKAVAGLDVRIADILGDIEYFQAGEYSYTFMIDGTGRTYIHPLMPNPFKVADDPTFIDISTFERSAQAASVIASMKNGENGDKTFITDITIGIGHSKQHGVEVRQMEATYYWRHIAGTNMSICMVFPTDDKDINLEVQGNAKDFQYHRFDVVEPDNLCSHAGRMSTTDKSSVSFTEEAYADILSLDSESLRSEDIQHMNNFMTESSYPWDKLKEGIKDTVVLTEHMDSFWKEHNDQYATFVSSRFLGTDNGVLRVYPGISLAANYSHLERAWYSDAVARKDTLVMSVPYEDAFGAGVVTSVMQSVLEGKVSHNSNDAVIGAIGADFNLNYIQYLVYQASPLCDKDTHVCFLFDESGFFIFHPELTQAISTNGNRHIIYQEPDIADYLIKNNLMKRQHCVSLGEKKQWYTWTVDINRAIQQESSFLTFEIHPVAGTNVFIGVKNSKSSSLASCHCPDARTEFECSRTDSDYCECPCYEVADYDFCSNSFSIENLPDKTCTPPTQEKQYHSPVEDEAQRIRTMPLCFDVDCNSFNNERECSLLASCQWCRTSDTDQEMSCQSHTMCMRQTTKSKSQECDDSILDGDDTGCGGSSLDNSDTGEGEANPNLGAIIGGVIGGIALIVIVLVVGIIWNRKTASTSGSHGEPRPPPKNPTAPVENQNAYTDESKMGEAANFNHGYVPPSNHGYVPPSNHGYVPPSNHGYVPQSNHGYVPSSNHGHVPPSNHGYVPPSNH